MTVPGASLPSPSYLLGILLFAFMGGVTALAFDEVDKRKAVLLGLGLPAMFQSSAQDMVAISSRANLIMPIAYAMEFEEPKRPVQILWEGEVEPAKFSLVYRFEDETRRLKDDFAPTLKAEHYCPPEATGVQAVVGDIATGPRTGWLELDPGLEPLNLILTVRPKLWSGLQKAVGIRDAASVSVELRINNLLDR
jgi:hypothetical protein